MSTCSAHGIPRPVFSGDVVRIQRQDSQGEPIYMEGVAREYSDLESELYVGNWKVEDPQNTGVNILSRPFPKEPRYLFAEVLATYPMAEAKEVHYARMSASSAAGSYWARMALDLEGWYVTRNEFKSWDELQVNCTRIQVGPKM